MGIRERLMLFAYVFIAGVAVSYAYPQPQSNNIYFYIALAVFGILWLAVTLLRRRGARIPRQVWYLLMLLVAATLGMLRYNQEFSVPDEHIGMIVMTPDETNYERSVELTALHRLRLQKVSENTDTVTVRISGLRYDRDGDEQEITSSPVVILPDDPIGTSYQVDEPFNRVDGVKGSCEEDEFKVALYAVSNHLSTFTTEDRNGPISEVVGTITIDPDIYATQARFQVEVETLRPVGADYEFQCTGGGKIYATIQPNHPMYDEIVQMASYGWKVVLRGVVMTPMAIANPGGFDYKKFLNNKDMYAVMKIFPQRNNDDPVSLEILEKSDGTPIVELALFVKDRMLRIFKQTIPYPESAFLGGVTLGMRYGLTKTMNPFDEWTAEVKRGDDSFLKSTLDFFGLLDGTNLMVPEEFKWAGINHVLAVSGLHVTIITIMFWGIFSMLRLPPKIYAPFIVFALLIFAIITGYRPSTQRAALMNSIAVLSTVYMGRGLRAGILFTIPVSGLLILSVQPRLVVEPSLTLSFLAVLSLGLLTTPTMRILARLRGFTFIAFLLAICIWTGIGMAHWALVSSAAFYIPLCIFFALMLWGAAKLNEIFPTFTYGFSDIPAWASGFFAAQFGIQFGMMIPLSSFYFGKWPFAGAYMNFLAIPLIGIIVQLGMIGGVLGIIIGKIGGVFGHPYAGVYVALLLNATNYFLCKIFLAIGHYSALLFPYPYVSKYSVSQVAFIYFALALFIWHQWLIVRIRTWWMTAQADAAFRVRFLALLGVAILGVSIWFGSFFVNTRDRLELTVTSVRYGESLILEAPDGSSMLINGGSRTVGDYAFDNGDRTIMPLLGKKQLRHLDWMVATTLNPECFTGLQTIFSNSWVDNLMLPFDVSELDLAMDKEDFLTAVGGDALAASSAERWAGDLYAEIIKGYPRIYMPSFLERLQERGDGIFNKWAGWDVTTHRGEAGSVLIEDEIKYQGEDLAYRVEVLSPRRQFTEDPIDNNSLVLKVTYGNTAFLLPSDIGEAALRDLLKRPASELKAQALIFPHHGVVSLDADLVNEFLAKVAPEYIIFSYQKAYEHGRRQVAMFENNWELALAYLSKQFDDGPRRCLRTDASGAVIVTSDGDEVLVDTVARQQQKSEIAVSDDVVNVTDTY